MTKRKNTFLEKPLPRFFGIFVLIASIGVIFWLSRNVVLFNTRAALGNTPKDIQVTNITDGSFTVSFVTDEPVNATLSYGESASLGQVAFDVRDSEGLSSHKTHYITVSGLEPGAKHFFSITSGDGTFQNDSSPFEITTAPALERQSSENQSEIQGQVIVDGNELSDEAIVYVTSEKAQSLSALASADGSFEISTESTLINDLSAVADLDPDTELTVRITNGDASSTASFLLSQSSPLPPITLSQNYDFTGSFAASTASESADTTPFPIPSDAIDEAPAILTPKTNEEFKDEQPLFRGTAAPESDVEILIESSHQISATVQADKNGLWEYRPDTPIEPGEHTITITAFDNDGFLQTLSRPFTVFAAGSQFVEPSVSPTPEPTPTITPTATPSPTPTTAQPTTAVIPSATPEATITPTPTPTTAPTAAIVLPTTAITTPSPTTQIAVPPVPDVGSSALIVGIVGAIIAIGIGGLLFLLL